MHRVQLTLSTSDRFPVPVSTGYSIYGALLGVLSEADPATSERIHEQPFASLRNSGLLGTFGRDADIPKHKTVLPNETYRLDLGIVDRADGDTFRTLMDALVYEDRPIELSHGCLFVDRFESYRTEYEGLLDEAAAAGPDADGVRIRFRTTTCIEDGDSVTTMFPHRATVFNALCSKWNGHSPDSYELGITRSDLLNSIYVIPNESSYDTRSILVHREDGSRSDPETNENGSAATDGGATPHFAQGFEGEMEYRFKCPVSDSLRTAIIALAKFGELSGVGAHVARGAGMIDAEVIGDS